MSVNLGEEETFKSHESVSRSSSSSVVQESGKSRQKKEFMLIGSNCQLFLKQHDFVSIFSVWSMNQLYKTWRRDVLNLTQCFKFNQFYIFEM